MGETAESVMVSSDEVDNLKMYCRGSENCCGKENNRICAEGVAGGGWGGCCHPVMMMMMMMMMM